MGCSAHRVLRNHRLYIEDIHKLYEGSKMIGIIIQARTGSTRFPNKIFTDINGKYTLQRVLDGAMSSRLAHKVVLAMPTYDRDNVEARIVRGELSKYIHDSSFSIHYGEPDNVLKRYYDAAKINGIDLIVRITADCPFTQGSIIDDMLEEYLSNACNGFMGNNENISDKPFPDGLDVEIFPWWLLASATKNAYIKSDREHVTPIMYRKDLILKNKVYAFDNCNKITMKHPDFSFDTDEDYRLICKIAKKYDEFGDLNKAIDMV